jgi:flagellar hook assembly protein FlgD
MMIAIYNSAGEKVKELEKTGVYSIPDKVITDKSAFSPDDGGTVNIIAGQTAVSWNGTNRQDARVENGLYYINVSITDTFGFTHTYSVEVTVLTNSITMKMMIFNSAGEIVKNIDIEGLTTTSSTTLDVDKKVFSPGSGSAQDSTAVFTYVDKQIVWDGTNDSGRIVGNGIYRVIVVRTDKNGFTTVAENYVTVLHESNHVISNVKVIPNPIDARKTSILTFKYDSMSGAIITIKIYNITGELVKVIHDDDNDSQTTWDVNENRISHGLYIAVIYAETNGGLHNVVISKLTIIK